MESFIIFTVLISAVSLLTPPPFTGTTPPIIDCPRSLCDGRSDGNYEIPAEPSYFVQCVNGMAYCQPCFPLSLTFSQRCNQCLYNRNDACYSTEPWLPATTYNCPDICPARGPEFSGNIIDPNEPRQYVACWLGMTVGCVACPGVLEFNEQWNACLYEGLFKTQPVVETIQTDSSQNAGNVENNQSTRSSKANDSTMSYHEYYNNV